MNIYRFIAQRTNKPLQQTEGKVSFSDTVSKVAITSIAIGLALIMVAFCTLDGFKESVKNRIFSFGGHIRISKISSNQSFEETPLNTQRDFLQQYKQISAIKHLQFYVQKAGVIKAKEEVLGVIFKGIGSDYHQEDFADNMRDGRFLKLPAQGYSSEIVISQNIADKLQIKLQDSLVVFFIQEPPRFRKLKVVGIYETGMDIFDEKMVLADMRLLQRLNQWGDSLVSGYEIRLKRFQQMPEATYAIDGLLDYDLQQESIIRKHLDIFDWLLLLDQNVVIFLGIILTVACFNIVSVLIIMMIERIQMIGILKALGADNRQIRRIFLYKGFYLVLRGFVWGNFAGLAICLLQQFFKVIPLDPKNYYMDHVPIAWDVPSLLLVNLGAFVLIMLAMLIPTSIISRIKPIRAMRFD